MEKGPQKIVILTGAGISAESGLGTFRDEGGLWAQHRIEDVATPEGFARDPGLVHQFYNARRSQAAKAKPNAAHQALAQLQENWPGEVVIITQNVDDLHEKGGAKGVLHMHGILAGALCTSCDHRWPAPQEMKPGHPCPVCNATQGRPDIVWFGEMPYEMDTIYAHLSEADIFVSIGTSGQVYPAAAFVHEALAIGAHTVEVNLEATARHLFAETRLGPASKAVPDWVHDLLRP